MSHEINIQKIIKDIKNLNLLRERLLASDLSPDGAWIHEYTIYRRYPSGFVGEYKYAKWQAQEPIFKRNPKKRARPIKHDKDPKYTCHQHIGRVWSNTDLGTDPEVEEAYQQWTNRKQLEAVEQTLQEIQSILDKFLDNNAISY